MSRPHVSVIIPVRDDSARLALCLEALDRQTVTQPFEVLVVDNGSSDDVEGVVAPFSRARLLREPQPSSYAARNTGVAASSGAVLAFTDSDCVPATDWLEAGVAALEEHDEPVFVGGRVRLFPQDPARPTPVELWELIHAFPQSAYIERLRFSVTANLFVKRSDFDRVGPFASNLISSGDREWGLRAHDRGVVGVYSEATTVGHPCRRSFREFNAKMSRLYAGQIQLSELRDGDPPLPWPSPTDFRPPLRSTLHNLRQLQPQTGRSRLAYGLAALSLHYWVALSRLRAVTAHKLRH